MITESNKFEKIYKADHVVYPETGSGIVTVTSNIDSDSNIQNALNDTDFDEYDFVAQYSWGRIYDFNRTDQNSFSIIKNMNESGYSDNPTIQRDIPLNEKY